MANAFLPLLHMMGLDDVRSFGDSTGSLDLNTVAQSTVGQG
jgi:hypothetical protein